MKVKAAKDGVMVRLVVNGMPLFVSDNPVDVDENNPEVMEQVDAMMKLGWLVEVKEEKAYEVKEEKAYEVKEEKTQVRGSKKGGQVVQEESK
jgi:hypothetical protein